jgi:hypothetical protein
MMRAVARRTRSSDVDASALAILRRVRSFPRVAPPPQAPWHPSRGPSRPISSQLENDFGDDLACFFLFSLRRVPRGPIDIGNTGRVRRRSHRYAVIMTRMCDSAHHATSEAHVPRPVFARHVDRRAGQTCFQRRVKLPKDDALSVFPIRSAEPTTRYTDA